MSNLFDPTLALKKPKQQGAKMLGDDVKPSPINATLKKRKDRKSPVKGFTVEDKIKARKAK